MRQNYITERGEDAHVDSEEVNRESVTRATRDRRDRDAERLRRLSVCRVAVEDFMDEALLTLGADGTLVFNFKSGCAASRSPHSLA